MKKSLLVLPAVMLIVSACTGPDVSTRVTSSLSSGVPAIEQKLSTAAAAQNLILALNAMSYGAIWRTGKFAFNKSIQDELGLKTNQEILGYLYVGTSVGTNKKIPDMNIKDFVSKLEYII